MDGDDTQGFGLLRVYFKAVVKSKYVCRNCRTCSGMRPHNQQHSSKACWRSERTTGTELFWHVKIRGYELPRPVFHVERDFCGWQPRLQALS